MRTRLFSLGLIAGATFALFSAPSQATCVANPPTQSNATFPASLTGKLAYHSYVSYGDGTSQIFIYDFAARTLTQVSKSVSYTHLTLPTNTVTCRSRWSPYH